MASVAKQSVRTGTRTMACIILTSAVVFLGFGCSSGSDTGSTSTSQTCSPRQQIACACGGGGSGAQTCNADGTGYGACVGCDGSGDPSDAAAGDGSSTTCPAPMVMCGTACVDPQTNGDNCGECGNRCSVRNSEGQEVAGQCVMGTCQAPNAPDSGSCERIPDKDGACLEFEKLRWWNCDTNSAPPTEALCSPTGGVPAGYNFCCK